MSRPWKLSPGDKDAIRAAHASGTRVADLAARYDVSTATIYTTVGPSKQRAPGRPHQLPSHRVTFEAEQTRPYRDSTHGYVPMPCGQDACGRPQEGSGHPRRGWVQLKRAGEAVTPWFCSFHCVSRYAIHRELAGADAA